MNDITKLNANQIKVLELLDDGNSYTITELCEKAGISRTTYYTYIQDDDFVKQLFTTSTGKIYAAIPDIMNRVIKQAKLGSFAHQKMLFEMMKIYQGAPQVDARSVVINNFSELDNQKLNELISTATTDSPSST